MLEGFPGVSYVGANGRQIGAPASRNTSSGPAVSAVTLAPGAMASASVAEPDSQNYPTSSCSPVTAKGFRVYAPDNTAAMFLPFNSYPECSNPSDTGLNVNAIVPGGSGS